MPRHIEQPGSRHSKPAATKILSSPSASACFLTGYEPGTPQRPQALPDFPAVQNFRGGAEVFDAPVGAGADENRVHRDFGKRRSRRQAHVGQGLLAGPPVGVIVEVGRRRDDARNRRDHPRRRSPRDHRRKVVGVQGDEVS